MVPADYRGTRSTAAVFGHPIHPMLVVFPIGFLVGALVTDLTFWGTADPFWARASEWLLGAGIVMGALAAVTGIIEFVTISRVRSLAAGWVHFLGNATAILLSVWNLLYRMGGEADALVVPVGIILSAIVVALFLVTGWLGGELVFRHRIGMIDDKSKALSPAVSVPTSDIELPREQTSDSPPATVGRRGAVVP
jgi:uncharacterized membrane protein